MLGLLELAHGHNPKQGAVANLWGGEETGYVKVIWTREIKTIFVTVPSYGREEGGGVRRKSITFPGLRLKKFCTNGLFFHHPEHGPLLLPADPETGLVVLPTLLGVIETADDLLLPLGPEGEPDNPKIKEGLVPTSARVHTFTEPGETKSLATGDNHVLCLEEKGHWFYPKPFTLEAPRAVYFALDGVDDEGNFEPKPLSDMFGSTRPEVSQRVAMWSDFDNFNPDTTYTSALRNLGFLVDDAGSLSQASRTRPDRLRLSDTDDVVVEESREHWYSERRSLLSSFNRDGWMALNWNATRGVEDYYYNLTFLAYFRFELAPCASILVRQPLGTFTPYIGYRHVARWHGITNHDAFPGSPRVSKTTTVRPATLDVPSSPGVVTEIDGGPDLSAWATVTAWQVRDQAYIAFSIIPGFWDYHAKLSDWRDSWGFKSTMINHRQTGINPLDYKEYDALHGYPFLCVYDTPVYDSPVVDGSRVDVHATSMQNLNEVQVDNLTWNQSSSVTLPNTKVVSFAGTVSTEYEEDIEFTSEVTGSTDFGGTYIPPDESGGGYYRMTLVDTVSFSVGQSGTFSIGYNVVGQFSIPDEHTGEDIIVPLGIQQAGNFVVNGGGGGTISSGLPNGGSFTSQSSSPQLASLDKGRPMVTLDGIPMGEGAGDIFPPARPMGKWLPWVFTDLALCVPAAGFYWAIEDRGDTYLLTIFGDNYHEREEEVEGSTFNTVFGMCRKCVTAVVLKGNVEGSRVVPVKRKDWNDRGIQNVTETDTYDVVHNPVTGQYFEVKDAGVDTVRAAFLHVSSKLKYSKLLLDIEGDTIEWEEPSGD